MALTLVEPRTAYARDAPWIGIGVRGAWTDWREALHESQLDFIVEPRPAKVELPTIMDGDTIPNVFSIGLINPVHYEEVPGVQVNVKKDSNQILGCVSSQYGIIQNQDAFSLLQPVLDEGAVITNAGMTEQGLCFMVAQWKTTDILGEEWTYNIMCTNSFNSQFPCSLIMVPIRIVCQNMYRKVLKNNDALLHIRHMRLAPQRIEDAKFSTEKCLKYANTFSEVINDLAVGKLSTGDITRLVEMLFPYPPKHAERYETSKLRVDQQRQEFIDGYILSPTITKWRDKPVGFLHAYYDYLSHRGQIRNMQGSWEDRRFSQLVSGDVVKTNIIQEIKNL